MTATPAGRHRSSLRDPVKVRDTRLNDLTDRKLFKDVDAEELQKVLDNGSTRICKLGPRQELSPTAGEFAQVYVILDGYVVISKSSRFDSEEKTFLAWRGPEQIIGEMRPLDGELSSATIETCDECLFLEIRNDVLMGYLVGKNPIIYRNIANLLLEKMASETHRSEVIHAHASPIEMRVALALMYLAEEGCDEDELDAIESLELRGTFRQGDLGAYIGATREAVNHALRALKEGGVIAYQGQSKIVILDRKELKKIAEDEATARKYQVLESPSNETRR